MSEQTEAICHECDNCRNPPTVNVQKLWVKWKYNAKEDEYSSKPELLDVPILNGGNLHFCDDCMKLWGEGKI